MKNVLFLLLFLAAWCHAGFAQNTVYAFRVYFKDKQATQYTLNQPEQFLSQRAIERRNKFQISVDSSDLPVCQAYVDSVLATTFGQLHCVSKWQNTMVLLLSDSNKILLIDSFLFFKNAQLVAVYPNGQPRPLNNTETSSQRPTGFNQSYYGSAWDQISLCNGQFLHQNGMTGNGILIAVLDAGFDGLGNANAFDSLLTTGKVKDRWNFVLDTIAGNNEGGHGTEVLSCISGNLPGTFVGTAPGASLTLYTTEDLNSEQPIEQDNWVAAAERADSLGVDIVTTSLGYNTFDPPFPDEIYSHFDGHTTFIAKGANMAASKGILVIASAGNEGLSSWQYILSPGDADSALTVGAVNAANSPFPQSGYGPNSSGRIKPDVVAMGVNNAVINQMGSLQNASGTSVATPIIAGLAACLMQAAPNATPFEIKTKIRQASDHYLNPDNHVGYGLPDFSEAYYQLTAIDVILNHKNVFGITIYPNPVSNHRLNFELPIIPQRPLQIKVLDETGRILMYRTLPKNPGNDYSIWLPNLSSGMYQLSLKEGNNYFKQDFILQ